ARCAGPAAGIRPQVDRVDQLRRLAAPSAAPAEAPADVWASHQAIWDGAAPAPRRPRRPRQLIARLSVLPSRIAAACALVERAAASRSLAWRMVMQGVGTGYVRLEGDE